ncbi:MAG: nucleoside deaminase [Gammaproteobacteria bacterium]|nr:nucleoside deaminase [Gammaproteobacteria bacterium]
MSTDLTQAMSEALRLAIAGVQNDSGGPFGAVVLKDGRIIAQGENRVTSTNDPTAHAEVIAIRAACAALEDFKLAGCILVSSCEPCPMCLAAAYWAGVDALYYAASREDAAAAGFGDADFYGELAKPPEARRLPCRVLAHSEAAAPFATWRDKADKIPY